MIQLISVCILVLGGCFSLTQYLHMLQQNSYFNSRYIKWLRRVSLWKPGVALIFAVLFMVFALFELPVGCLVMAVLYAGYAVFTARIKQKKAIKPLVFTARIKRMYVAFVMLNIVFLVVAFCCHLMWLYGFCVILCLFPGISAIVVNSVNIPVESIIRSGYIAQAKKSCGNAKI